jgi:hypothetical protein
MQIRAYSSWPEHALSPIGSAEGIQLSLAVGGRRLRRGEFTRGVCSLKDAVKRAWYWRLVLVGNSNSPMKSKLLKLINLKFEHLDEIKDLAAKLEHLR